MGILALLGTWRSEVSRGLANGTRGEEELARTIGCPSD